MRKIPTVKMNGLATSGEASKHRFIFRRKRRGKNL